MKKYILLNGLSYGFLLNVKGRNYSVRFAGASINKGTSEYSKAHFSTNNKDLQDALESCPMYNKKFVLAGSSKKGTINETTNEPVTDTGTNDNSTNVTSNNGLKPLKATNKQGAVEELKALFPDLQIPASAKNNEIELIANEKGYTFPYLTKPTGNINNNSNNNN
jgi:hypothetical protein